jgi:tRNA U34 5-carboxymethylaminomethyl modifying enzyme MnmG/GidA
MVGGELSFSRKHIGNADYDIINQINKQVVNASESFKTLIRDKNDLIDRKISFRKQSELAGRLFFEEQLIKPNQLNIIKNEMNKPSYKYNVDMNSAWAFYNHVTHAMKETHPKTWMQDQKKFHEFMTTEFKCNSYISKKDTAMNEIDKVNHALLDVDFDEIAI